MVDVQRGNATTGGCHDTLSSTFDGGASGRSGNHYGGGHFTAPMPKLTEEAGGKKVDKVEGSVGTHSFSVMIKSYWKSFEDISSLCCFFSTCLW